MAQVFKLFRHAEWAGAVKAGVFQGSADDLRDGYIHLSAKDQVAGTAAKYFCGEAGLVLVAFDAADLSSSLKWEAARGGQLFPHLYVPLNMSLARATWHLRLGPDGIPEIPSEVTSC